MAGINPVLAAAAKTQETIVGASEGIQAQRNSQQDIAEAMASAQLDIGRNNQILENQKVTAELVTQTARLKAGNITGTDLNQQGEQISGLVDTMNRAYQEKMAAAQLIQEKRQVGFMDNPLQHILNLFTINDDIDRYQAADMIQTETKAHIDELNQISNTTAKNQANFTESITQAGIEASASNTLKTAQLAADKAKLEGINYNIDGLKEAINASKENLHIKFQVLSAQNAQAQLGLAMQNYALHKQEFDWKKEEKAKAGEGDEFFIERMQKGFEVMYGKDAPNLVASPKLARQYLMLLKSNTLAGKEATDAYMAGQSGVLGGSPAQVTEALKSGIRFQFTPVQEPIRTLFDTATQEIATGVANGTIQKAGAVDAYNGRIKAKVDGMLKDIEPGASNLFNIGAVKDLVLMPGVADTALAQKVLTPAAVAGAKLDDPKQVFSTTMAAVGAGTIKIEEAVEGINALYRKGVETNLAARNLTKFGIVPTENMRSYNTKIQTNPSAIFGGTEIVNLTDPNSVKRAILKNLSSQRIANTIFAPGGTNPMMIQ